MKEPLSESRMDEPEEISGAPGAEAELIERLLAEVPLSEPTIGGVVIGRVVALGPAGEPVVDFPGNPSPGGVGARTTAELGPDAIGCEVALMFEGMSARRPIVMGRMQRRTGREIALDPPAPALAAEASADGERIVIAADKEIVLQCGRASITLTRAGKILIRGEYVVSRATGLNRLLGGSVQIN
jgi:hypothetical protein